MADFWDGKGGLAKNLRLLTREGHWLAWEDEPANSDDPTSRRKPGCKDLVEKALLSALHSTNAIVLLGSGASFCAKNADGNTAPGMADLWTAARASTGKTSDFDDVVLKVMGRLPEGDDNGIQKPGNIESLLSLCKMSLELLAVRSEADPKSVDRDWMQALRNFIAGAEIAILDRVDFVGSSTELPAHLSLLRKLARRSVEKPRVRIFTTNYDLCIEEAALRLGIVLIDGFSHSAEQRFNRDHYHHDIVRRSPIGTRADFVEGVVQLYKLHGSVDWRRRKGNLVVRKMAKPSDDETPVLIYPRSTKYQEAFETPYLEMFSAFQASLREPDTTLLVSGFGFNDDHISAPIWSALESNLSLRLILCDRAFVDPLRLDGGAHTIDLEIGKRNQFQKRIMRLVQQGDARITILNGRFEDVADALPNIEGHTDRQRLYDRLEQMRDEWDK